MFKLFQHQPQFWYKKNLYSFLLLPFAALYYCIVALRKFLYKIRIFKSIKLDVPTIIVGNITVGGTGKTPLVIKLAEYLKQHGLKPGIVSRGYIPKQYQNYDLTLKQVLLVSSSSDVNQVGDEAMLIVRSSQCPMAVAKNRVMAAQLLQKIYNCDVIISDDGLQHYALGRDIEIVVTDADRGVGNGFCLPAGPLRESKRRLQYVDFIINNCSIENLIQQQKCKCASCCYPMILQPTFFYKVGNSVNTHESIDYFKGKTVHAVAGIGNPNRFFNLLRSLSINVIEHPFPDHYFYQEQDLDFGDNVAIIMTEKDAVKCENFAVKNLWQLKVEAQIDEDFFQSIADNISVLKRPKEVS